MQLCQALLEASYALIIILRKGREMAVYITESSREPCQAGNEVSASQPGIPTPTQRSPFSKRPLSKQTDCLGRKV